jgi:uncharacterized protein DUF3300
MIECLRRVAAVAVTLAAMVVSALPAAAESAGGSQRVKSSTLSTAQLAQLVAPIALYPDPLLSQILMASTYPLEVADAARWSNDNPDVNGQALEDAMADQSWDPSVKALTALPQTLRMMNDKADWMQQLGDAFLAQQPDVLDAIQKLRARAEAAGHLETTPQQKIAKVADPPPAGSSAPPATVYTIEPATSDEYYVPIYDPGVVYGTWPYPDDAPFYWHPPGYSTGNALAFAAGVAVGAAIWGRVDWWQDRVNINVNRYNRFNRTSIKSNAWRHDPAHRHGVAYSNRQLTERFANGNKDAARVERSDPSTASAKSTTKSTTKTKSAARSKQMTAKKSTKRKQTVARTQPAAAQPQPDQTTGAASLAGANNGGSVRRARRR